MDIQFVLDVYACAMYIVSYISKAQKGMSELLRQACTEARKGNSSTKQPVRDIGNKFLHSVEISAQEATSPHINIYCYLDLVTLVNTKIHVLTIDYHYGFGLS